MPMCSFIFIKTTFANTVFCKQDFPICFFQKKSSMVLFNSYLFWAFPDVKLKNKGKSFSLAVQLPQKHQLIGSMLLFCDQDQLFPTIEIYTSFASFYQLIFNMPERKSWTQEEDKVLKHLYEQVKLKKWSKIARTMAEEYKMPGRNGKQCRERYHNHLDSSIVKQDWSRQEELNLYELHNQIGNKWAVIALKMPGRTDNCVKNHFYSKLRKALRKLNKVIHDSFKREFRQIRMTVLYKILEATDDKFKDKPTISAEITDLSAQLKNKLLHFSHDQQNVYEGDLKKLRELILQIHQFSHNYKRKPKKCRRGASQSSDLMRLPKIDRFKCSSDIDEEDEDDENQSQHEDMIPASHEESFQIGGSNNIPKQDVKQSFNSLGGKSGLYQPIQIISPSVQEQNLYLSNSLNVENILKQAGVLQDVSMLSMSTFLKKSLSVRSDQSENREKTQGFNLGDSIECINFAIPKNGDVSIDDHQLFQSN